MKAQTPDLTITLATSEVALLTGSIDGGYTNEEITSSVDLALGGSVVDIPDTAIDAILTGVGGLGIFATMKGLVHAQEQYEKGGDIAEAYLEGAGVAIAGTARLWSIQAKWHIKLPCHGLVVLSGECYLKA